MSDDSPDEQSLSNPKVLEELRRANEYSKSFEQAYIQIDEFTNSLDFLDKAVQFLSNTNDGFALKWATLAISDALYGFMICVLTGSDYHRVLRYVRLTKNQKNALRKLSLANDASSLSALHDLQDQLIREKKTKLISFGEALKRIQMPKWMEQMTFSKVVELSKDEQENIKKLRQELRNYFEHFTPTSWAIERAYFLPLLKDSAECIRKIVESGNLYLRDDLTKVKLLADQCCNLLDMHTKLIENIE